MDLGLGAGEQDGRHSPDMLADIRHSDAQDASEDDLYETQPDKNEFSNGNSDLSVDQLQEDPR